MNRKHSGYAGYIQLAGALTIVGGTNSLEPPKYYEYGTQMFYASWLFLQWLAERSSPDNSTEAGGVRLWGNRYGISVEIEDDKSSRTLADAIYCELFQGSNVPDFVFGPYSTPLNIDASEQAQQAGRVLMGAGAWPEGAGAGCRGQQACKHQTWCGRTARRRFCSRRRRRLLRRP